MMDSDRVEILMAKPYWLVDLLPKQVPEGSPGQYFRIERFYLSQLGTLCRRFAGFLIRLNCYSDLQVSRDGESWSTNISPEEMILAFEDSASSHTPLFILAGSSDTLVYFSGDDHNLTLYNPDPDALDLMRQLAASEGLFVWGPQQFQP